MKLLQILLFCFLLSFSAQSQVNHFIYLQTENKQAFYVKLNDKLFSSSASGYLIIPKLTEGAYALTIGFPKNEWPAKQYNVQVGAKDAGYLLKNFDKDGWALFNLQTLDIVRAYEKKSTETTNTGQQVGFTEALSQVSDIKKPEANPAPVTEKILPQKDTDIKAKQAAPILRDSVQQKEKGTISQKIIKEEVAEKPMSTSKPRQLSSRLDNETRVMTYVVEMDGKTDTVVLSIPYANLNSGQPALQKDTSKVIAPSVTSIAVDESKKKKPVFIEMEIPKASVSDSLIKEKDKPVEIKPEPSKETVSIVTNNNCRNLATNQDFLDLRKQMAAAATAEEMMDVARKEIRRHCYSALQVKNLAVLFLDDQGRYGFLDLAYVYCSDQHNYKQLRNLLTDEYYLRRFDAMIR